MDVLMRTLDKEPYVWTKAKFVNGKIIVNNKEVYESDIVSIRNDVRKRYVKCSACGKYFKKGSKKIEQHKEPCTDSHLCFGCNYLRQRVKEHKLQKYELLENGNYISKSKSEVFLYCAKNYSYPSINKQEARDSCIYNKCQNATIVDTSGFFITHPGAFDDIITIDKILECGYKQVWETCYDKRTTYLLKAKNRIEAIVNKLNIVEGFHVYYRTREWTVFYSKKYNELYTQSNSTYVRWNPHGISLDVVNRIKEKIAKLYV